MITISGKINAKATSNGTITGIYATNLVGNNVSANIEDVIGKRGIQYRTPFILGSSKLGSGACYSENLPYFIGSTLSDSNGDFPDTYYIDISGTETVLTIAFDTENGGFPRSIKVDSNSFTYHKTFVDDDAIWEIPVAQRIRHRIEISNWNKPNAPLIITGIYSDTAIDINSTNLISFSNDFMATNDINLPSYGLISNNARLTVVDYDEQIIDLINQGIINNDTEVSLSLNDTKFGTSQQILNYTISDIEYNNSNRQANFTLKDTLVQMQDKSISAINYNPSDGTPHTAKWFYEQLYTISQEYEFNIVEFDDLDTYTQNVLSTTTIQYPVLDSDGLWAEWDKLCQLCRAYMYCNSENIIEFRCDKN